MSKINMQIFMQRYTDCILINRHRQPGLTLVKNIRNKYSVPKQYNDTVPCKIKIACSMNIERLINDHYTHMLKNGATSNRPSH